MADPVPWKEIKELFATSHHESSFWVASKAICEFNKLPPHSEKEAEELFSEALLQIFGSRALEFSAELRQNLKLLWLHGAVLVHEASTKALHNILKGEKE